MNKNVRTGLVIAAIAVAAYLAYRWWENRSANTSQGLGSNLGSAGFLVGGSTGPSSGLNYYEGAINVTAEQPVTQGQPGSQGTNLITPVIGTGEQIVPGSNMTKNLSWTNQGQKWTPNQLAAKLGIPLSALGATNAQAKKALSQPNALMPKGSKFTYTKAG